MMPAAQIQRFAYAHGTDNVQLELIPRAGHFAHTDQLLRVSDTIINFIRRVVGREAMGDIHLGSEGIWKGDERDRNVPPGSCLSVSTITIAWDRTNLVLFG